jgi:PPOX class probable F420-dependent enzyme
MAREPVARRPHMPEYGTLPADEGTGLLPWSWAVERLTKAHDYWVATTWPDGRPHVTPVWGAWIDDAAWFSCAKGSRKARNLAADPRCAITNDNAYEPVVLNGVASAVDDHAAAQAFTDACNGKYTGDMTVEFVEANALFRVPPTSVLSLTEDDFNGSPTLWTFE